MKWWNGLPKAQRRTIALGAPVVLVLAVVAWARSRSSTPPPATADQDLPPVSLGGGPGGGGGASSPQYGPPMTGAVGIDALTGLRTQLADVTADFSEQMAATIAAQQAAAESQQEATTGALDAIRADAEASRSAFLEQLRALEGRVTGQPRDPSQPELLREPIVTDDPEEAVERQQEAARESRDYAREQGYSRDTQRQQQGTAGEVFDQSAALRSAEAFVGGSLSGEQRQRFLEQLARQQAGTFVEPNKAQIRSAALAAGLKG